ncbi:uncharacterized protein PRCAT00003324001 [Priceomyces carsonii]|uniref:uncharacterized protein n=1 Tax=Priceomyces carsonii TaxID=28549 RepID=UPI002EDB78ED|nr:unnamed protein product [Priceomyces carsonii]
MTSNPRLISGVGTLGDSRTYEPEDDFEGFTTPEKLNGTENLFIRPPAKEIGIMNYSPKHSKKPSSLGSRNMKNLSLNLLDSDNSRFDEGDSNTTDSYSSINPLADLRRNLTLSIPSTDEKEMLQLANPLAMKTPNNDPSVTHAKSKSYTDDFKNINSHKKSFEDVPFKFPAQKSDIDQSMNQSHIDYPNLKSPLFTKEIESSIISKFSQMSIYNTGQLPEELQESNQLDAYLSGPANVLNDTLYLYSDPLSGPSKVDINLYDLVINVAKECEDLSPMFDHQNGSKEYLYVPWSHTSSILKQLSRITQKILQYDDSQKTEGKRKILVHCQCGVSRSACVVVAYFMLKFDLGVNEAYELLKSGTSNVNESTNRNLRQKGYYIEACDKICPNMSLIFELMEFGDSMRKSKTLTSQ